MRKVVAIAVLTLLLSCKTAKQLDENLFTTLEESKEYILLKKKETTLNNHGNILKESSYSIKIPTLLTKTVTTVTTIPNTIEFVFTNNQKIFIINNSEKTIVEKLELNRESFLFEITKLNIFEYIDSIRLKDNRYFGIQSNMNYFLIYLNVKKANLEAFNNSIKSQEIFP